MKKSGTESYKAASDTAFSRIGQWIARIFDKPSIAGRDIGNRIYPTITTPVPSPAAVAPEIFQLTEDMMVKELSGGKKIGLITLAVVAAVGAGAVVYRKLNPPQKTEASWAASTDASPEKAVATR